MPKKQINIIAFDIPYPPDYGGVIDIYFKIKAFHESGTKIHLHCYEYCRKRTDELNKVCESVSYYKRQVSKTLLLNSKPYIVVSRTTEELIKNLQKNNFPIFFEGLHCCYYLDDHRIKDRFRVVRSHNIEHNYYNNLAKVEKDVFRKYYFRNEARKLKRFEKVLSSANAIAAISQNDFNYFSDKYKGVHLVSAFHPNEKVDIETGKGDFVLYHGSLEVGENNEAALFLVNNVFKNTDIPLIIAGNKPSEELKLAVKNSKNNIQLKNNISTTEIYELIRKAQINILPTFQATGIKLKLLAALFSGRHCIANSFMVNNTGLQSLCSVKNTADEMNNEAIRLFKTPFTKEDIQKREHLLNNSQFSNKKNISSLIEIIFPSN